VTAYRNTDVDVPFYWDSDRQPAGRWHGDGEGPVQYLSTSPEASWAEFLRHQGITDPADLAGIERTMWAIELDPAEPETVPSLDVAIMTGDATSYSACQAEARALRAVGTTRIIAPSAAKAPGTSHGWMSDPDLHLGPPGNEATIVLIGRRPGQIAHMAAYVGRPDASLLPFVVPL
jgi:RES domain